jgi:hypothetical protein
MEIRGKEEASSSGNIQRSEGNSRVERGLSEPCDRVVEDYRILAEVQKWIRSTATNLSSTM